MPPTESMAPFFDLLLTAKALLNEHEGLHSEFQIRWLIIARNGITLYGCLKQTILEIETRILALNQETVIKPTAITNDVPTLADLKNQILNQRQSDLIRELQTFCEIAVKLKASIGPLTSKRRYELELELWTLRVHKMAANDFMTQGRLCRDTLELMTAIPFPQRSQILRAVLDPAKHGDLVNQYVNSQIPHEFIQLASTGDERATPDCRLDVCETVMSMIYDTSRE